jgi:hypothetical protein
MRTSAHRKIMAGLAREDGFGIIEGVVAALMLALTAIAVYGSYDTGTKATQAAKQSQVELGIAQDEMEQLRSLPYNQIALTSLPSHVTQPSDPFYRVVGSSFNLDRSGSNFADIVYNNGSDVEGGTIDPGPDSSNSQPTGSGEVGYTVWRMVVWQSQPGCPATACNGHDVKRVVIIVQPTETATSGARGYLEIHSDFVDPEASTDLPPGTGSNTNHQPFYLSDTSCDPNGPTVEQSPTSHKLHNTLGDCTDGTKYDANAGAPDSLLLTPPQETNDPPLDYETDFKVGADDGEGIQIDRQCRRLVTDPNTVPPTVSPTQCAANPAGTSDCNWLADPAPNPQTRFHIWLSDEVPVTGPFNLNGPVTLNFYSRTLDNGDFSGKLCFWLFRRDQNGTVDQLFSATNTSPSWTYSSAGNFANDKWPQTYTPAGSPLDEPPHEITTTADVGSQQVPPFWRLGLAVSVSSDTPGPLSFMFDDTQFPATLSVDTPDTLFGS